MLQKSDSFASPTRIGLVLLLLSAVVLLFTFNASSLFVGNSKFGVFGTNDFVEYWTAFRAVHDNHNPYDPNTILNYQHQLGSTTEQPLMMWNPPWVILLLSPILRLEFIDSARLWFVLNLACILLGTALTWFCVSKEKDFSLIALGAGLWFFPIWYTLALGQISAIVFLGAAILFWALVNKSNWLSGIGLVLLSFKPHVAYLWLVVLAWTTIRDRNIKLIGSVAACFLVVLIGTQSLAPGIFNLWLESLAQSASNSNVPVLAWQTPNLVGLVRSFAGNTNSTPIWPIIFVPGVTIIIVLATLIRKRGALHWNNVLPPLLCLSCFTAPFGWVFDCSLLVITQLSSMAMLAESKPRGWAITIVALLAVQLATLVISLLFIKSHEQYFWFAPVMLVCWLSIERYSLSK
jgi:hypothetical protein